MNVAPASEGWPNNGSNSPSRSVEEIIAIVGILIRLGLGARVGIILGPGVGPGVGVGVEV